MDKKNDRDASMVAAFRLNRVKKPGPKPCSQDEQKLNTKKLNNQRLACAIENLIFVHLCITKIMRTVKEIMKPVVNIGSNRTVLEAANLMNESGYSSLLIVDGKITVGIITARDLVIRAIAKNLPHTTPVSEVMSSPLITINANVTLKKAARIMGERKIRRLPVTESGGVAGILVASDVLCQLSNETLAEDIWEALVVERP